MDMRLPIFGLCLLSLVMPARAKEFCKVTFTSDAAAIENNKAIRLKGSTYYAVLYRINKRTGDASICGKGEYCYPASKARFNCKLYNQNYTSSDFEEHYGFL